MPVMSIGSATAEEGNYLIFNVTLDAAAIDAVTVDYQVLPDSAADTDIYYNLASAQSTGTLTFAPGETSQTVRIYARNDSIDERDEAFSLRLSGLSDNSDFVGGEDALSGMGVILDNDGTGSNLAILVSDVELVEGDSGTKMATFDLRLSRPADQSFTVSYRTRDITATAGEDYAATRGSVTFAEGDTVKTVSVPVFGDTLAEITESFALVVTDPGSPSLDPSTMAGVATIRSDDGTAEPVVSVTSATASEANYLAYTITLSEPTFDAVSMSYRMLPGTGIDTDLYYDLTSAQTTGVVNFAPGETSKTVFVYARSETEDERDESMILELSGLSDNASFDSGEAVQYATGVILDNDGTGSNLALFVSDANLVEGDRGTKDAVFELRLSRPVDEAVTFTYRTRDISARAGEDYEAVTGSVSFAPGEQVKAVRVAVNGDTTAETTESFALVVAPPDGLSLGLAGLAGEAVIRDNDTAPAPVVSIAPAETSEAEYLLYTVTLSEPTQDEVSMSYRTITGTADSSDIYYDLTSSNTTGTLTFAAGEIQKTVRIYARSESEDERDENAGLQLFNLTANASFAGGEDRLGAMGIIRDNDGVGGNLALLVSDVILVEGDGGTKQAEFELRLSQPAEEAVQITYSTRDITAKAGEDYAARSGSVSFAPGEEVKVVRVPVFGDTAAEFSERFALRVEAPGTPGLSIENAEPEALILDDDTGRGPSLSATVARAIEGEALIYTLMLSESSQDAVTVDYRLIEGTATEPDIYYAFTSNRNVGTVTFAPGQTTKNLFIYTSNDSADERDETVFLELSNAANASLADGAPSVLVPGIILDNDGVGLNRSADVAPTILREHGVDSFIYEIPVELSSRAAQALQFTVQAVDQTAIEGSDYRLLDSFVNFAPGQRVATVSVEVLGDSRVEGTEAFTLSLEPVSGTPYAGSVADQVIYIRPGPLLPSPLDDVLTGTVGDDSINLLAGNDLYDGLEGNDTALGGNGDDTIIGGAGEDSLNGQFGNDLLIGGPVFDVAPDTGARIYRLYQATLDRAPDTTGFDNWSARLESGAMPLIEVISGFVGSPEFQATYGTLGNQAFVTLLYNNVLERDPDATGLANWTARLATGTSREQVVQGFSESAEFIQNTNTASYAYVTGGKATPHADDVYRLYQATLDRAPDFTGLQNWADRLGDGMDFLTVVGGFVNSPEFQNTYGAVGNQGFVRLLYNNVLDRDPDATGLANWTARLNSGMSREEVVRGFSQSPEFINNMAEPFKAFMAATPGDTLRGGPGNDLIYGGLTADTFVFNVADKGSDRLFQLDPWDSLAFTGFGYDDADDAAAQMRDTGSDVVFSDQGVVVTFMRVDLNQFDDMAILV